MLKKTIYYAGFVFVVIMLSQCVVFRSGIVENRYQQRVVVAMEPVLYVVPGTYVYYASIDNDDLFYSQGYWWRSRVANRWDRAETYSGPWTVVIGSQVPLVVYQLPQGQRNYRGLDRVGWNDVKIHWREWERDKRWDKKELKQDKKQEKKQKKRK